MRVVVAGGHGKIARLFGELASTRHDVVGLIRDPGQTADLEAVGMRPEVIDLEAVTVAEVARVVDGADALVFAAGAGPGSGAHRKETVDFGAAVTSVEAAEQSGVRRFLMISAMGTDDDPPTDPAAEDPAAEDPAPDESVFSVYLRAKARADRVLMASTLDWTVVRPGHLTDDSGTGRVRLARHVPPGDIARRDVAAVLVATLGDDRSIRRVFEVVSGETPIPDAVADLASADD